MELRRQHNRENGPSTSTDSMATVVFQSVMFDSLWPHGLQDTWLPCPSLPPGVCSHSCPLSQWCHPTMSSSVTPFSSCPQSFPASGSFPTSRLFASGRPKYWSFSISPSNEESGNIQHEGVSPKEAIDERACAVWFPSSPRVGGQCCSLLVQVKRAAVPGAVQRDVIRVVLGGIMCSVPSPGAASISCFICKKALTCLSADEWINTVWSIQPVEYYSAMKKYEVMVHATVWMSLPALCWVEVTRYKRTRISWSLFYEAPGEFPGGPAVRTQRFSDEGLDSSPGWGNKIPRAAQHGQKKKVEKKKCVHIRQVHRWKADQWLGSVYLMDVEFSCWVDENVLALERDGVCTALWTHSMPLNCTLSAVTVNFYYMSKIIFYS